MGNRVLFLGLGFWCAFGFSVSAQQVRVMQWNVLKGLGNSASINSSQARALARVVNYNQPDILLFNEVDARNNRTAAQNEAAIIAWITNNVPYLGTQPGVTFFVKASSRSDGSNRNAAVSRFPVLAAHTYTNAVSARGLHAIRVQVSSAHQLQVYHAHLKCCADDCPRKQNEAQFDSDVIKSVAATNSTPYIFAGDWNEDEEALPPVCTLSATYHPISTIRTNGGLTEFKPTTLSGDHRTWSTGNPAPFSNIRFDYILAATNRLNPISGFVFSTMDWAAHGLYTNASPQNLVSDSQTASDHYCVFADYYFSPRITSIIRTNDDILITWLTGVGKTNALQVTSGGPGGSYSNNFMDLVVFTNAVGSATNYLDAGAATNTPARYYRVRLVP